MKISELFEQIHKLPNVPEVIRELIQQLSDPDIDLGNVAEKVTQEQVVSMKVLRLVNSAHFGLTRKVSSIEEAVVMLGMQRLKTLVIASGIVGSVPSIHGIDIPSFWRMGFKEAIIAKWLAEHSDVNPDTAFTTALIRDMGRLLMFMGDEKEAAAVEEYVRAGKERAKVEMSLFGFTAPEVGAELTRQWRFPDELVDAIEQYRDPLAAEEPSKLAAIVNIAVYMAHAVDAGTEVEEIAAGLPEDVLAAAGLDVGAVRNGLCDMVELDSGLDSLAA